MKDCFFSGDSRGRKLASKMGTLAAAWIVGTALFASSATKAQVAGSVEAGLAELAQQIVAKSIAAGRTTISVLPFRHADGSCSVLSTYVVDELILSLFSVPGSRLDIIERAQLEALVAELQIGEGGLLNPKTTKQLGNLSGVSALVIGTITVIGDSVRLNARLVATDTGRTVSAAAVTIPKTQAVIDLLRQAVTTGLTCTPHRTRGPAVPASSTNVVSGFASQGQVSAEGLQFHVAGISRSKDKAAVNLTLGIVNITEKPLQVIWVQPVPTILDDRGNTMSLGQIAGQQQCSSSGRRWFNVEPRRCPDYRDQYTTLTPGTLSVVNLRFTQWKRGTGDKTIEGQIIHFAGTLQILTGEKTYKSISISIPSIPIPD